MKSFVLAICGLALAGAAEASPCGEKIAALQTRSTAAGPTAADAPETTSAKLHRQPTAGSVEGAETNADSEAERRRSHVQVVLEEARAADNSGDARGCEAGVAEAQRTLGR